MLLLSHCCQGWCGRAGIPAEDLALIFDLVQLDPQAMEFLGEGNDRFLE